jgi:hypothetical protein
MSNLAFTPRICVQYVQMMMINWWKKWIDFVEKFKFHSSETYSFSHITFCPHDDPQVGTHMSYIHMLCALEY